MNLLVSESRALRGIERDLVGSDPRLATLFATFMLLTRDEELPSAERLTTGPVSRFGRRVRSAGLGWPVDSRRARLWPLLLLTLVVLACAVAVVGIGRGAARSCPPPSAQHAVLGGHPSCARDWSGIGGK